MRGSSDAPPALLDFSHLRSGNPFFTPASRRYMPLTAWLVLNRGSTSRSGINQPRPHLGKVASLASFLLPTLPPLSRRMGSRCCLEAGDTGYVSHSMASHCYELGNGVPAPAGRSPAHTVSPASAFANSCTRRPLQSRSSAMRDWADTTHNLPRHSWPSLIARCQRLEQSRNLFG